MKLIPKNENRINKFLKGGPAYFKLYGIDLNKFTAMFQALVKRGLSNQVAFEITWQSNKEVPKGFYSFGSRFKNVDDWADNVVNHLLNRSIYKNARNAKTFNEYRKATMPYNRNPGYTEWLLNGRDQGKGFINQYIEDNNLGKPVAVLTGPAISDDISFARQGGVIKALFGWLAKIFKSLNDDENEKINRHGWTYDKTSKKWNKGDKSYRSFYAKPLSNGSRLHFNSDGTVSTVNKYNYVGKAATGKADDVEGIRSLKQHILSEIKILKLTPKSDFYTTKQVNFKNTLRQKLLASGFSRNQTEALLMNAADESAFRGTGVGQRGGGAKGIWQLDGNRRREFEKKYKNDWSIDNQIAFLRYELGEKLKSDDSKLHYYSERNDPNDTSVRVVSAYNNIPRYESQVNLDSVPTYDLLLRGKYVDKADVLRRGQTLRYTGLPLNHYVKIFNSESNTQYSPEELSFMFMAGFENAGRPSGTRLDTSIYAK